MATLHVRNVPDDVYESLRARAEKEGRSIGAETIALLDAALEEGPGRAPFAARLRRRSAPPRRPFERFAPGARQVVVAAQHEARAFGHAYVGTEHLLLGLLADDASVVARALEQLGVTAEAVRERVRAIVGAGEGPPSGALPFTPRTKKALELALRESLQLGDDHISSEHLLLGLAVEGEGLAARILRDLGADEETIRLRVFQATMEWAREPAAEWEYRAVALAGGAERWTETLNRHAGDGWELFAMSAEGGEPRAVLRRRSPAPATRP